MNVIEYRSRFSDVIVDLAADTARDGRGGTDTLANIQGVRGSEERDIITGDAAANQLVGEEATTICLALAATTSWSATTISTRGPERSAPIRSSTPATICWMAARATTG